MSILWTIVINSLWRIHPRQQTKPGDPRFCGELSEGLKLFGGVAQTNSGHYCYPDLQSKRNDLCPRACRDTMFCLLTSTRTVLISFLLLLLSSFISIMRIMIIITVFMAAD